MWNRLSSLTDQISQIASEAIGPLDEEDEDALDENEHDLPSIIAAQRREIEQYKKEVVELQERLAAGEIHSFSDKRSTEQKESFAKNPSFDDLDEATAGNVGAPSSLPRTLSSGEFFGQESPSTDSIQSDSEARRLAALLAQVQAENRRLKNQVADLANSGAENNNWEWRKAEEEHQQQVATLQALQQEKLKQLAASHQEDLTFLQERQEEADAKISELTRLLEEEKAHAAQLAKEKLQAEQREKQKDKERENERELEKERERLRQEEREREKADELAREDERRQERERRRSEAEGKLGAEESLVQLNETLEKERELDREKERERERARERERELERERERQHAAEKVQLKEREEELLAELEKEKAQVNSIQEKYNKLRMELVEVEKRFNEKCAALDKLQTQEEAMMQTVQLLVGQKESFLKEREEAVDVFRSLKELSNDLGGDNLNLVESAVRLKKVFSIKLVEVQKLEMNNARVEKELEALKKGLKNVTQEKEELVRRLEKKETQSRDESSGVEEVRNQNKILEQALESIKSEHERKWNHAIESHKRELEKKERELREIQLELDAERQRAKLVGATEQSATAGAAPANSKVNPGDAIEEFSACSRCFELEQQNNALQEDVKQLKEQLVQEAIKSDSGKHKELEYEELKDKYEKSQKDIVRLRAHLLQKEEEHNYELLDGQASIEALKKQVAEYVEKENAMKAAVLKYERLQSDYKEKELECEQNAIAVMNLQNVLEQLQAEQEAQMRYELGKLNRELNLARDQVRALQEKLQDAEKIRQRCEEAEATVHKQHEMLSAKSREIIKLQEEVEPLRRGLEESIRRLHNATEHGKNLVDKRLVSKLFVTYFSRASNQQEVLGIMSNILDFTQEEKIQVGLIKSPRPRSWFFGGWGGSSDGPAPNNGGGGGEKTLTDLWVEFLLKEASSAAEEERRQQQGSDGAQASEREEGKEKEKETEKGKEKEKDGPEKEGGNRK